MRHLIAAIALSACASAPATVAPARASFSLEDFLADPASYAASHYADGETPSALAADLGSLGFECRHSATMSSCSRARHQVGTQCFDVINVYISADTVSADQNPRCLGAHP